MGLNKELSDFKISPLSQYTIRRIKLMPRLLWKVNSLVCYKVVSFNNLKADIGLRYVGSQIKAQVNR